jgi:hypothetical protein
MNTQRSVTLLALGMLLAACAASTGTSATASVVPPSGIVLREAPEDLGCDSIGWKGGPYRTLTFHVDHEAAEPVWAESDTGTMLTTYWSSGFQVGDPAERQVLAPSGDVFVTDGEVVEVPQGANLYIDEFLLCLQPDKLYVVPSPGG